MGITILPPDVNKSYADFRVIDDKTISYGLAAIKNVGYKAAEDISVYREDNQQYKTIFDLLINDSTAINKKTLESLILAGACDNLEGHRAQQYASIDKATRFAQLYNQGINNNQESLFGADSIDIPLPSLDEVDEWSKDDCLSKEKEIMGFYISGNPLESYKQDLQDFEISKIFLMI